MQGQNYARTLTFSPNTILLLKIICKWTYCVSQNFPQEGNSDQLTKRPKTLRWRLRNPSTHSCPLLSFGIWANWCLHPLKSCHGSIVALRSISYCPLAFSLPALSSFPLSPLPPFSLQHQAQSTHLERADYVWISSGQVCLSGHHYSIMVSYCVTKSLGAFLKDQPKSREAVCLASVTRCAGVKNHTHFWKLISPFLFFGISLRSYLQNKTKSQGKYFPSVPLSPKIIILKLSFLSVSLLFILSQVLWVLWGVISPIIVC